MNFEPPKPGYSPAVPQGALEEPYFITNEDVLNAQRAKANDWRQTAIPSTGGDVPVGLLVLGAAVVALAWLPKGKQRRR